MSLSSGSTGSRDGAILLARILLMLLFLIFGWEKLVGFSGTVAYFTQTHVPMPEISAIIAVVMEFFVGIAIVLGLFTRPLALLLALYTLGTALIGHPYWTLSGMAQLEAEINFFKNISIIGGLILLIVTGAGRYSIDGRRARR
ncbi:DoxX family protein [Pararobbsia silviterrae]|uniref:DoxX family protein n=2 Tax=Pararobbsia silviterrae TaxID=1792498 RepID=A0A494XNP2_9BURK|nr:DoxX family protein [Pararobbsia silviterrae]